MVELPAVGIRWQRLLTIVGAATTVSAIAVEVTGYFHFIRNINDFLNLLINSTAVGVVGYSFAAPTLNAAKLIFILVNIWLLFFVGLHRYARFYESLPLADWIIERRAFMKMPPELRSFEVTVTTLFLFALIPVAAISAAILPPWRRDKTITLRSLSFQLWPLLLEVLFLHALVFVALMITSSLFKGAQSLLTQWSM
jgi:hypothetical protein